MKKILLIGLLCATLHVTGAYAQRKDSPAVAALRKEAAKRGLKWKIFCFEDDEGFRGWATPRNAPWAVYVEEGAKAQWFVSGTTQDDAALALLEAIKGEPDAPHHVRKEKKHLCPPELHGE